MVVIIGDTTSRLSESFAEQHRIPIVPQVIIFGETSYLEGQEIDYPTFIAKLQGSKILPKTAAPSPSLFAEVYTRCATNSDSMICILPSAAVSGTYRSAIVGKTMLSELGQHALDIRVIDTRLIATPVATLIRLAVEWAEQGKDVDAIEYQIREMSQRGKVYFIVDTLEYLAKGGRIGGAAALLGNVLQVKPVLALINGQVDVLEKVRTRKRSIERLKQLVVEQIAPGGAGHLSIMHVEAQDEAEQLAVYFRDVLDVREVPIATAPPAIATHGGPGALGVGFFTE